MEGMSLRGLIEGMDRELGLFHCGKAIHGDTYTLTLRNTEYAFHFGDDKNLVHAFDLRSDPGEDHDLWNSDSQARHSVDHSLKDAQEDIT